MRELKNLLLLIPLAPIILCAAIGYALVKTMSYIGNKICDRIDRK